MTREAFIQQLKDLHQSTIDLANQVEAAYALLVGRELKDVAEHMTNIAETVIYIVTATTVELR